MQISKTRSTLHKIEALHDAMYDLICEYTEGEEDSLYCEVIGNVITRLEKQLKEQEKELMPM